MVHLNHAGTSWPKPAPVQRAVADALAAPTVAGGLDFESARERVARTFGVADPERLLLTPGCTSALSVAVADHAWRAGDRVLTSALEHHALRRPVEQLTAHGVVVETLPRAGDAPLDLDALEHELARGNVRLVALTAACNVTGELLPIADVVRRAHEHGALCLVDGAQVAGWLPLDVGALGIDLFAFAGHKALQAPWGIGGLIVAPGVELASPAASCDLPVGGAEPTCRTLPGYCDVGSVDRAALAGLVAALDWLDEPERADRLSRARALVERVAAALAERPGVRLLGMRDPAARLPTVAFTIDGRTPASIARAFETAGITVAAGEQCAPLAHAALGTASVGAVRLSAGPTTTTDDVERALAVVRGL